MDQNSCAVTSALEAPFVMSQLLSKLDPKDDIDFGREMQRVKNEENVLNLIDWLNKEASLRSRVKRDICNDTEIADFKISEVSRTITPRTVKCPMMKFVE